MTSLRRCLQRLSIIVLSLMAILAITVPSAQADEGDEGGGSATITINQPDNVNVDWYDSDSQSGMTVNAYMVLSQVNPEESDSTKKQYEVTTGFEGFFNIDDKVDDTVEDFFNGSDPVYLRYDSDFNRLIASKDEPTAEMITIPALKADQLDANYPQADLISRIDSNDLATFYTWIEKYIESQSSPLAAEGNATVSKPDTSSITLENLKEGYYALTFSNVPSGIVVKQGILIPTSGSGEGAAELDLKAEQPSLVKQVKNPNHNGENFSNSDTPLQETTAGIGDTLEYQITSQVPTLADTENLTDFKLEDTQYNQKLTGTMTLTLEGQTTTEFVGKIPADSALTQSSVDVPLIPNGDTSTIIAMLTVYPYSTVGKSQTFTVDFLHDGSLSLWENYRGYNITLTYQATVTADAVRANDNDVTLYIGNNNDTTRLTDKTTVYTYGIKVHKTFSDGTTTNYDKVTFVLYPDKNGEQDKKNEIALVQTGSGPGKYHRQAAGETPVTGDLNLDSDGTLTITGLDLGTYWLVETAAPSGFTMADPIKIVLVDTLIKSDGSSGKDGILDLGDPGTTATINNGEKLVTSIENSDSENTSLITLAKFDVLNQKGFKLPSTGAAGVWLCVAGGLVLIAVAGVLFVASRGRRNAGSASRA